MINQVISFLKGKNKDVKNHLTNMMNISSENMLYEDAARLRDQLEALKSFELKQSKLTQDFADRDIINISFKDNYGIALVMRVRNGLLVGKEKFNLQMIHDFNINSELEKFLVQYYKLTMDFPKEVIICNDLNDKTHLLKWLHHKSGKKISIIYPIKGEKKHMLDVCIKNNDLLLKDYIFKKIKRKEYTPKTLSQLKDDLNMSIIPKRIEAFDNSNIQGAYPVAGMVCFIDGKPLKKEYRKFKIKSVSGIDDYESMREVLFRRYSRQLKENNQLPDLILIDGGKGQLSAAKSTLDKLGLGYLRVVGLAKRLEEIYVPESSEPQSISKTSSSIYLLRKIRDEVHRFSVSFHRQIRSKNMTKSILSSIKGLSENRIKLLWKNYNSFSEILLADTKTIYECTKIPANIIKEIKVLIKNELKESDE